MEKVYFILTIRGDILRFLDFKLDKIFKCLLALLIITSLILTPYKKVYSIDNDNKQGKIVMIDPGHGGIDGGALAKDGTCEKDINLSISKKLKKYLEDANYKVIMTRNEDKGLYTDEGKIRKKKIEDLNNRCKEKINSKCDIFISIHLNMFPEAKYSGAQVWYGDNEKSRELASIIQKNMVEDLDKSNNRKEKPAGNSYKILRCGKEIPSVIVECGFLSNPSEKAKLMESTYQDKVSASIGRSVKSYFEAD